ncbi:hypothetical protein Tco_0236509 [Tanacetum coccineum]
MQGTNLSKQERDSRLKNEFDKFTSVTEESIESCDDQEDKLKISMMLLARAITQCFSTTTNNRLITSSSTRNQAYVQDGRVDVQTKNVGNVGGVRRNTGCNGGIDIPKDEELQELNASCIMMARIQTIANDSDVEPSFDSDFIDEKAIAHTPKLYSALSIRDSNVPVHVHDSEDILEDAEKESIKNERKTK